MKRFLSVLVVIIGSLVLTGIFVTVAIVAAVPPDSREKPAATRGRPGISTAFNSPVFHYEDGALSLRYRTRQGQRSTRPLDLRILILPILLLFLFWAAIRIAILLFRLARVADTTAIKAFWRLSGLKDRKYFTLGLRRYRGKHTTRQNWAYFSF